MIYVQRPLFVSNIFKQEIQKYFCDNHQTLSSDDVRLANGDLHRFVWVSGIFTTLVTVAEYGVSNKTD